MSKSKPPKNDPVASYKAATDAIGDLPVSELLERLAEEAPRKERIELRVTPAEKELIGRLAERCGVSVTELLVRLAGVAAEKVLAERWGEAISPQAK